MYRKSICFSLSLLIAAFSFVLDQPCAKAQFGGGAKRPARRKDEYNTKDLEKAPDLPHLPPYPGKGMEFSGAMNYPNLSSGGHCYTVRYKTHDEARTVIDWYDNAFRQYGWTIEASQRNDHMISARRKKEGVTCLVVSSPLRKGSKFKSAFMIRYIEMPVRTR